jgi:hypothetical protein
MRRYKNMDGTSGIVGYQIRKDAIKVKFDDGAIYEYTYASAGKDNIEEMKTLARQGRGLNTYISQHVQKDYASRLH